MNASSIDANKQKAAYSARLFEPPVVVDVQKLVPVDSIRQALRVDRVGARHEADRRARGELVSGARRERAGSREARGAAGGLVAGALDALNDPVEDARVLAVARPQEAAVRSPPEPVHVEDARQLQLLLRALERQPVREIMTCNSEGIADSLIQLN